jgi:signal transduction histidine kinase
MTPSDSQELHPGRLRLVWRSDPALTGMTVDHVTPRGDDLACRFAGSANGGHRHRSAAAAVPPDRERESLALAIMVDELTRDPGNLLQRLVEVVTGVCGLGTAAVAMTDGKAPGWDAVAGPMADSPRLAALHRVGAAGRGLEGLRPLGAGINREPSASTPSVVDAQAIPLVHDGSMVGVLWIANHDGGGITADDERVVRVLAQLASSAWTIWARSETRRHANDRKSELLALVGDELRNPLSTIATAATLLHDRGPGGDAAADAAEVIAVQCQFMSRVVGDLLDTARLDLHMLDLHVASIDIRATVVDALASWGQEIERHGHTLSLDLGDEPLKIDADPVRLAQMVSNLVDNAVKYTARGGRIVVSLRRTADDIRLTVSDTGDGLPADHLTGIVEPYASVESWKRSGGGLGLGLPLVRRLAELHGGSLHATSPGLGEGSSFVITLPPGAGHPADASHQVGGLSSQLRPLWSPSPMAVIEPVASYRRCHRGHPMVHDPSLPPAMPAPLEIETQIPQPVTCPLCHVASSLTAAALTAGGYWRCARCGQDWDAARLAGYADYAAWVDERDASSHQTRH